MLPAEASLSGPDLHRICQYDRPRAFAEMARQLGFIARQIEHSAALAAGSGATDPAPETFAETRAELLARAGGGVCRRRRPRCRG